MAKRKGKDKPKKESISVIEAFRRLYNLEVAILCHTCDKTDCVNRFKCPEYKSKKEQFVEQVKEIEEKLDERDVAQTAEGHDKEKEVY